MIRSKGSYLAPQLEVVEDLKKGGFGVKARQPIFKDDLLAVWSGVIYSEAELAGLSGEQKAHSVEIEDGLYLVSLVMDEPADFINHSCNPNAGMRGQICIVAMRNIEPGEEITMDYAMVDSSSYDAFACACGEKDCRGWIDGTGYKTPVLWEKYAGYFAPHIQRKIDALKNV